MKLTRIFQNINNENPVDNVDLIIACCGYELRCTSLIQFYQENVKKVRYKRAICFNEPKTEFLNNNQDQFKNQVFFLYDVKPNDDFAKRLDCVGELLGDIEMKDSMVILIDYSSMNREWYSAILIYLEHFFPKTVKTLECRFYYRIPVFDEKKDEDYSFSHIHPLDGFEQFVIPDRPLSLIIGLGSEEKALNGIWQYADVSPEYVHYFYTNNEHIFNTTNNYKELFAKIKETNKHEYKLDRMVPLFNSLCDLYNLISETNRLAIISCGPKPFTLLSLVFARLYNVDVWKLDTNLSEHSVPKAPSDRSIVLVFEYSSMKM